MSEDFYTYKFKPFRNRLAKYDAKSIVFHGIRSLHKSFSENAFMWLGDPSSSRRGIPLPWNVLLLIKWAIIHGGNKLKRTATYDDFISFYNNIYDFQNRVREFDPDDDLKLHKLTRTIAFQQFWLEREFISTNDFSRQILLFDHNDGSYPFREKFFEYTGLNINEFLELSLALITIFYEKKPICCEQNNFSVLSKGYSPEIIDNFFNCLSLDFDGANVFLNQYGKKIKNSEYQLSEQTPLKLFPILKDGNQYFPYFLPLLRASISDYIYDHLKLKDPSKFSENFGSIFQSYIKRGLYYLGSSFKNDKFLIQAYGKQKLVDFVLMEDDCTVMIEAKAIEMSPLAKVNPTTAILTNYLKDSIVKAFKQIYSTVQLIHNYPEKVGAKSTEQFFALIITFRQLYLGDVRDAWVEFIEENIKDYMVSEEIDSYILPPSNIFFIAIDEYDLLITILKAGNISLSEILSKAINDNSDPSSAKYVFKQHLANYDIKHPILPYLDKAWNQVFDSVVEQAKQNNK